MPVKPEENNVLKQCHAALGDITNSGININVTNSNLYLHFHQVCNEDGKTRWSCHAPKEKRRKKGMYAAFKETFMNTFRRSPGSVNVPVQESGDCLMSQPSHDSQNSTAIQGSDECRSLSTNRPMNDLSAPPSEKVNKLSKVAEDSSLRLISSSNNLITTDNNSMELQKESMFDSNSPELSQHTLVKPASTLPQENLNLNSQQENSGSTRICPLKDLSEDALLKKSSSYEDKNACVLHLRPSQPVTLSEKTLSSGYPNITNTMYPDSQCHESSNYETNPTSIQVCTKLEDYDSDCFKDLEERNQAAKAPDHSYVSSPSSPVLQVPGHLHLNEGMSFGSLNGEVDSDISDSCAGLDNYRSDETFNSSIGIPSAESDSLYQMNDETNLSVDNFVSELSVKETNGFDGCNEKMFTDSTEAFTVTEDSSKMETPQHNFSDKMHLSNEMVGYKHDSSRIKSPQVHTSIETNLPVSMMISESETSNKEITHDDVSNDISCPDTLSEVIPPKSHAANMTHPHDTCMTVNCEFDKSTSETVQDNVADDVKNHDDTETSVPSPDVIGDNTLNEVCESVHNVTVLDETSVIAADPIQEKSHQYNVTTDNTKQEMKKTEHLNVTIDLEVDHTVKETEHEDESVDMTLTDEVIESLPMSTTIEQSQHGVFGKTIMTEETVESLPVSSRTIVTLEPDASVNTISPESVPISSSIETLADAVTSTDKSVHSEHISECLPVSNESLETRRHYECDEMELNKKNETLRPECLMETTHGGSHATHTQENQIDGSFSRKVICDISNVDSFEVIKEQTSLSKMEKFSPSTLPTVISYHTSVDQTPEKKIVRQNKKKRKTRSKKSRDLMYQSGASDIVMSSMSDTSICTTSLYNSSCSSDTPRTKRPPRQKHKLCPEVTSPHSDKSNIEQKLNDVQMSSIVIDSGIGASNDLPSCIGNEKVTGISIVKSPDGDLTRGNIGKVEVITRSEGALNIVQRADQFKKILNRVLLRMHRKRTKSLVRELHVGHRYIQLLQFGLGSYFDRLNNGPPPSLQEQMHYEWLRLASFQHYTGSGNAIHLARNGFYHRHTDGPVSTRCIYCDVTCNNWQYFDDIAARHRELSPQCPFHGGGQQPVNVSITGDEPQSTNASAAQASGASSNLVTMSSTSTTGPTITACPAKARSATSSAAVNDVTKQLATVTVSQARPNNTRINSAPAQPTEDPEGTTSRTFDTHRGTGRHVPGRPATNNNENTTSQVARNQGAAGSGNFVGPTGTSGPPSAGPERDTSGQPLANVRHPQYSTMAQRIDTFQGFPDHLDQTPEQMALAGFYYVGVADFTRCFCCGGGLRNWEAGDDPLLEHTRWFPRCEYVRRLKGDSYVAAVQRRHQEHMEEQRREQLELANRNNVNNTPAPDPMTTDAARVMREMGYDDNKIRHTILAVRRQIGTHLITPQQVLSWLLDQDDSTTRTAPPPVNDENSVYAGIHMANNDSDNESFTTARQDSLTTTTSGITSTISTTADTTRLRLTGTPAGSNNTMVTSSYTGNQSTTIPAAGAGATTGASSLTGAKKNVGKKKKKTGRSAVGTDEGGKPSGGAVGGRRGPEAEAARKIQEENEKLRDMQTCKICMERLVNTTMLPCGHLIACDICAARLRDCPVCRTKIKGTVKTYLS